MNEKEFYLFVHGDTFEVMIHLKQFSWSKKVLAIRLKGFGVFTQIVDRTLISCTNGTDLCLFVHSETFKVSINGSFKKSLLA